MSSTLQSNMSIDENVGQFLERAGLVKAGDPVTFTPLTGGVASDIFRVDVGQKTFVIKKALSSLRVAQEWLVPVSRNESEVGWFLEAQRVVPHAVPDILAHDSDLGIFAMSYLDPAHHPVWKEELREGRAVPEFAASVGRTIAAIHNATAGNAEIAARFANDEIFHAIRLEPYLEATAQRHSDLADRLFALSRTTMARKVALVHGDVSPKNILVGPHGPVLLDAECAWYGDPAFDLAFCLNHLLLKCIWQRHYAERYLACFDALARAYLSTVSGPAAADVERHTAALLPALFLGRVDGKSPAEYVTRDVDKDLIRSAARQMIEQPPKDLSSIRHAWAKEIVK